MTACPLHKHASFRSESTITFQTHASHFGASHISHLRSPTLLLFDLRPSGAIWHLRPVNHPLLGRVEISWRADFQRAKKRHMKANSEPQLTQNLASEIASCVAYHVGKGASAGGASIGAKRLGSVMDLPLKQHPKRYPYQQT